MTQQVIDIGSVPDDGIGDPLRTSFDKTNENFTELYAKGATEGLWNYNQTSTDTSTSPVSGRFKTNSGNYRDATQIAIHTITIQGIDRSSTLRTLLVGDLIQCQDSTNSAAWCRFGLQSLPVDHGTWFQLNVALQADGGVASGDNQEIVFIFTAGSGSGVGAPVGAEYITATTDATLTAERVLTNTATITWDFSTAGQAKASTAAGGGNVSNSGTPTAGQYGKWVTATTIQGVAPATVLSDIGAQPAGSYQTLDATLTALAAYNTNGLLTQTAADTFTGRTLTGPAAGITVSNGNGVAGNPTLALANDLAALEALAGTNTIYYRSAIDTWSAVTIGTNLTFSGGTLAVTIPANYITSVSAPLSVTGSNLAIDLSAYLTTAAATATYQPLDGDLTAIAALAGTNTIYYRSAANTWTAVTVGTGLAFSGGNLTSTVTSGAPVGAEYITSTTDATLTAERVLTDSATVTWDRTTAGQIKANAAGGGNVSNSGTPTAGQIAQWTDATHIQGIAAPYGPPQGRLTFDPSLPVMTTTIVNQFTIFYTAYVGTFLPIYDGTNFVMTSLPGQFISCVLTDTTKNPSAIGVSKVNDWFVWNDAGTVRLGHGPDWTNDTTRSAGTALVMVNGVWLNNASITNGPAASRGTYVGTTRSNATSTLDWIYGTVAASPVAGVFGVWNMYNRCFITSLAGDLTDTWTYSLAAVRAANAKTTMRHSFISGMAEDAFEAIYTCHGTGATAVIVGVCYDVTNAFSGVTGFGFGLGAASVSLIGVHASIALGFHFFQAGESAAAATAANFFGDNGNATLYKTGIVFKGWM